MWYRIIAVVSCKTMMPQLFSCPCIMKGFWCFCCILDIHTTQLIFISYFIWITILRWVFLLKCKSRIKAEGSRRLRQWKTAVDSSHGLFFFSLWSIVALQCYVSWIEFPVTHSRFSLLICFIHSNAYISVWIPQFTPSPPWLLSPTWCLYVFLYVCVFISVLQIRPSIPFF